MASSLPPQPDVRLAEVVGALSLATDLAVGQPLEQGLRRTLLVVWLGEELRLGGDALRDAYYVGLLGALGCTIEVALAERPFRGTARPIEAAALLLGGVEESPPRQAAGEARQPTAAVPLGSRIMCRDVSLQLGEILDIGPAIREALGQTHEQWDGAGAPRRLKGDEISLAGRLFLLAHSAEKYSRIGGLGAATAHVRERSGQLYDPHIATRFCEVAGRLLDRLHSETPWDAMLAAEPTPARTLAPAELDKIAWTVANFVDLRSEHTLGHSTGVAALAEGAARQLGLSELEATALRRAGLFHDLGRAGIPVSVWDKRDPLTAEEWERVKRHPSLTELVLARSGALGHLGTLAGLHHERLDGSGYRGVPASFLPAAARVLAAADAYESKLEPRPHRAPLTPAGAAEEVSRQAAAGRLDADAVAAVLAVGGHRPMSRQRELPAGLSQREVEVLRLAVRGLTSRLIAETLVVSKRTVDHHIQHIYDKTGVSTRAGATLFALRHGLVPDAD
jgi:HD-GYP domain-containing protein (c-di-GMP phosphodiesterase class II)